MSDMLSMSAWSKPSSISTLISFLLFLVMIRRLVRFFLYSCTKKTLVEWKVQFKLLLIQEILGLSRLSTDIFLGESSSRAETRYASASTYHISFLGFNMIAIDSNSSVKD